MGYFFSREENHLEEDRLTTCSINHINLSGPRGCGESVSSPTIFTGPPNSFNSITCHTLCFLLNEYVIVFVCPLDPVMLQRTVDA